MSGVNAENIAAEAKGLASEAIGALRSHERLNDLQFITMERNIDQLKGLVEETGKKVDACANDLHNKIDTKITSVEQKIDQMNSRYDAKFWGLALIMIGGLLSGLVALFMKVGHP